MSNHNNSKFGQLVQDEEVREENNKLQAYKSSFQAWKCVSFGCSLLAIIMLASKCHEVSTDLNLLLGIQRLLLKSSVVSTGQTEQQQQQQSSSDPGRSLTWPPVPIELLLPAANESNLGLESMESNETMLMSHLQMSLSRELNGDQLLRQEVDAFVGESSKFRSSFSSDASRLSCICSSIS